MWRHVSRGPAVTGEGTRGPGPVTLLAAARKADAPGPWLLALASPPELSRVARRSTGRRDDGGQAPRQVQGSAAALQLVLCRF